MRGYKFLTNCIYLIYNIFYLKWCVSILIKVFSCFSPYSELAAIFNFFHRALLHRLVAETIDTSDFPYLLLTEIALLVSCHCKHLSFLSATAPLLQKLPGHHISDADLHQGRGLHHRHPGAPQRDVHPERGVHWPTYCQGRRGGTSSFFQKDTWKNLNCVKWVHQWVSVEGERDF